MQVCVENKAQRTLSLSFTRRDTHTHTHTAYMGDVGHSGAWSNVHNQANCCAILLQFSYIIILLFWNVFFLLINKKQLHLKKKSPHHSHLGHSGSWWIYQVLHRLGLNEDLRGHAKSQTPTHLLHSEKNNPVSSVPLLSSVLCPKPFYSETRRPLMNKTAFSATISLSLGSCK